MAAALASAGENRNAYRIVTRKSEGKRSHGMFRRRWEDNIEMNLKISVGTGLFGSR